MDPIPVRIAGLGRYLPERVVDNAEIAELCGVQPDWVLEHTGVRERRWARGAAGEDCASMAAAAAREALAAAGVAADELDLVLYASSSVQQLIPDTSVFVQRELGIEEAGIPSHSVHSTCLSFLAALDTAACRIAIGRERRVLIVSAEQASFGLDFDEPESAALFGDGAAAAVLEAAPAGSPSAVEAVRFETYASGADLTCVQGYGIKHRPDAASTTPKHNLFAMNGPEVLRFTLRRAPRFLARLLRGAPGGGRDLRCVIPHQTSKSGMEALERLGFAADTIVRTLDRFGNQVAASIPTALYEAVTTGRLQRGDRCLLTGTGAGLTLGGLVLTY